MCPGFQICVGVDAHIDPLGTNEFAEDFRVSEIHFAGTMWASSPTVLIVGLCKEEPRLLSAGASQEMPISRCRIPC